MAVGRHTGPLTPTGVGKTGVASLTYLKFKLGGFGGASPTPVSYTLPEWLKEPLSGSSLENLSAYLTQLS